MRWTAAGRRVPALRADPVRARIRKPSREARRQGGRADDSRRRAVGCAQTPPDARLPPHRAAARRLAGWVPIMRIRQRAAPGEARAHRALAGRLKRSRHADGPAFAPPWPLKTPFGAHRNPPPIPPGAAPLALTCLPFAEHPLHLALARPRRLRQPFCDGIPVVDDALERDVGLDGLLDLVEDEAELPPSAPFPEPPLSTPRGKATRRTRSPSRP